MKRLILSLAILFYLCPVYSQNPGQPEIKTVSPFKSLRDSASYGVGCFIVNYNQQQGITGIRSGMVSRAIEDLQSNKPLLIDALETEAIIRKYQVWLAGKQTDPQTPGKLDKPDSTIHLKDLPDSASYALGLFTLNLYRQYNITDINGNLAARAINDIQEKKTQLLSDAEINRAVMAYQQKIQFEKVRAVVETGNKYLEENKKRDGVKFTGSGLQYEIITAGTGPVPMAGDTVLCHYSGRFINGKEFDNSYKTGGPVSFAVTGVIQGWTEALLMMPVGSKWKVYVPYQLGYGLNDYYSIPGGSTLIFDMELVGIKGK